MYIGFVTVLFDRLEWLRGFRVFRDEIDLVDRLRPGQGKIKSTVYFADLQAPGRKTKAMTVGPLFTYDKSSTYENDPFRTMSAGIIFSILQYAYDDALTIRL